MKISADPSSAGVAAPGASAQGTVANDHRWLADLERSWLQSWQSQSTSQGEAASSSPAPLPDPAQRAAAAQPVPDLGARADAVKLVPATLWSTPQPAHPPLPLPGPLYGILPPDAMPVPVSGAEVPASNQGPRRLATAEAPTSAATPALPRLPDPPPAGRVAFHVAVTEVGAQVSLRDASLGPQAAVHTGQAIARQLGDLGLPATRVYVNGVEVQPPGGRARAPAPPAANPIPRSQEK